MKINSPLSRFDGKALKAICVQKGIPLWKLAQACGVQPSRLSDFIAGRRDPKREIIISIAKYINEPAGAFYAVTIDEDW